MHMIKWMNKEKNRGIKFSSEESHPLYHSDNTSVNETEPKPHITMSDNDIHPNKGHNNDHSIRENNDHSITENNIHSNNENDNKEDGGNIRNNNKNNDNANPKAYMALSQKDLLVQLDNVDNKLDAL